MRSVEQLARQMFPDKELFDQVRWEWDDDAFIYGVWANYKSHRIYGQGETEEEAQARAFFYLKNKINENKKG